MKWYLLNIDRKMFYKEKENWNQKFLSVSYHFLLSQVLGNWIIQYKPFWFLIEEQTSDT